MLNILVTGANGQLGNEMRLLGAESKNHYIFTDVAELDITNAEAVRRMAADEKVAVIVNCAAYTNVDKAEENYELADLLNNKAVANLAAAAKAVDATLIHISTDYVFQGDKNLPCREEEPTNPLGVYGKTKLAGERAVAESGCKHLIFRTAWLYSQFGNNFVKTMMRLTAEREQLTVVFDQVGTPTYAADLAAVIFGIIEHQQYTGNEGIYHFSNEGVCSWFDFAHEIALLAGNTRCNVQPCYSSE
ncbi:MAG: dTDP-4-dehydrorhamnose reductase, partial [Alistipes sp.]